MGLRRKAALIAAGVSVLTVAAVGYVWFRREPIAKSALDSALAERGVKARYDIKAIGTSRQRIENIVIGDPSRPDLTADWAEIDVSAALSGFTIRAVRAGGVRLAARLADGKLVMGDVDKLLPAPTGEPFAFPAIDLAVSDARIGLATPFGPVGIALSGQGPLATAFKGRAFVAAPRLEGSGCVGEAITASGILTVTARRPGFAGPVTASQLSCAGTAVQKPAISLAATASETFSSWRGTARLEAERVQAARYQVTRPAVALDFDGSANLTKGGFKGGFAALGGPDVRTRNTGIAGRYAIGAGGSEGPVFDLAGALDGQGITPSPAMLRQLAAVRDAGAGTPIGPIAQQIGSALARLGDGNRVVARFDGLQRAGKGRVDFGQAALTNRSGARITLPAMPGLTLRWPEGVTTIAGTAEMSGGGLPNATIAFDGTTRGISGRALVRPIVTGDARLSLSPVRFAWGTRGLTLDAVATMDGPLASGRIEGLVVPLALRPGVSPLSGCISAHFRMVRIETLRLSPASLKACIAGGDARIAAPRLSGWLGSAPIGFSAADARYGMARSDFALRSVAVRLGQEPQSQLDLVSLSGSLNQGVAKGQFSGASGKLGAVPLLLDDGRGDWRFAGGVLTLGGAARVSDAEAERRFNPLVTSDVALRMADGQIFASATLREPQSGQAITRVDVVHRLGPGTGEARLDVDNLAFGPTLQPELITPITLGVVANVVGTVDGKGNISWSPDGVTSSGAFRTDALDFAAAFGPVAGLSGEIRLSDLLGMETPAGQSVRIRNINPGIAVIDGEIRYRLLPGLKAQVEGGRWPFAGGFLVLEPTVIDMAHEAERRFTFRVEGVDAAAFINQLQFENIAGTGTFDGVLPMVFDRNGGRIEGGRLIARAGGGTLAYVGELSNENLGAYGSFAFDALKAMKYDRLSIDLGGAIDGDIVTKVSFAGVNQAPLAGPRTKLPIPVKIMGLDNIPFVFNITITAPFRKLFDMSRTINDPSLLIERLNPKLERVGPARPIQPSESQDVRKTP